MSGTAFLTRAGLSDACSVRLSMGCGTELGDGTEGRGGTCCARSSPAVTGWACRGPAFTAAVVVVADAVANCSRPWANALGRLGLVVTAGTESRAR